MKLSTRGWAVGWFCLDDDTYDAAPDAGEVAHLIGYGATEAEAIGDWKELWAQAHGAADWEEWIDGQESRGRISQCGFDGRRGQNNTKDESAHEKHSADAQEALDTEFGE